MLCKAEHPFQTTEASSDPGRCHSLLMVLYLYCCGAQCVWLDRNWWHWVMHAWGSSVVKSSSCSFGSLG